MFLLGIDTGTTNWKANLYDRNGRCVASASMPAQVRKDSAGRHYYDAEAAWKAVCGLTRQVARQIRDVSRIKAVGFASMAEAGLLVDREGRPLTGIIPWYDDRSVAEKDLMVKRLGRYGIFRITGTYLTHIYSAPKILWFKSHEKSSFKKAAKWLCFPDYLIYRFSGEYATDHSIATRTAAFDIGRKKWAPSIMEVLGVKDGFFPCSFKSGTVVGAVTKAAAAESGLTEGTKIAVGGHDHVVGAYGIGLFKNGDMLDSIGTAESVVAVLKGRGDMKAIYDSGFSIGCYTHEDMYYLMSGIYCSGGLTEWFMREFYGAIPKAEKYRRMGEDLKNAGKGAGGVRTVPYWLGRGAPYRDASAKGAILGLTAHSTRADILVSIFEGLSFEFRQLKEEVEKAAGIRVKSVNVIGGGAKNAFWLKRKADIIGAPLIVPKIAESVCFGAAMLAGKGAGLIKEPSAVTGRIERAVVKPDISAHHSYDRQYKQTYKRMGDIVTEMTLGWKNG